MISVVFLRGVNLGSRRVTNPELAAAFERLGLRGATPYQASGNVILPETTDGVDADALESGLAAELGWPVVVYLRTAVDLRAMVGSPFAGLRGADGGKPQVVLLRTLAAADRAASLGSVFPEGDRFDVQGTEVHWLPQGGLAGAGPLQRELDRVLGDTTVRTLATIERIVARIDQGR